MDLPVIWYHVISDFLPGMCTFQFTMPHTSASALEELTIK